MNGTPSPEAQKPPPTSSASTNGHASSNSSLAAKKRKKDGLKPIITMEGPQPAIGVALAAMGCEASTPPSRFLQCFALFRAGRARSVADICWALILALLLARRAAHTNMGPLRLSCRLFARPNGGFNKRQAPFQGTVNSDTWRGIASHYRRQQRAVKQVETSVDTAHSLTGFARHRWLGIRELWTRVLGP
ncbi:hypothetical protein FDECE_6093 [Fusarium decemcellulare]|nr:hypothetical protein FDECE_6093 [Fusarium decemcellulare]